MSATISSISSSAPQSYISPSSVSPPSRDRDGDHDGDQASKVVKPSQPKPVSATVGNYVNTTA